MAKTLSVKVGNNTSRSTVLVDDTKTIREVLEENKINYATAQVTLDGAPLVSADLGKTLETLGVSDGAYILAVQKTQNA